MNNKDYYQILGIAQNASAEEIKKAYRRQAMQCHPDHNHGNEEWAHHQFKEINEAYGVLGDPKKRSRYDNFGTIENLDDVFSRKSTQTAFEDILNDLESSSPDDDFANNILGDDLGLRGFKSWTFKQRFYRIGRNNNETQREVDIDNMFPHAKTSEVNTINYEIVLSEEQAVKGIEKELMRKGTRLKVDIPAGVKTGSRIKLRDALETTDGRSGDIIISVIIK